MRRQRGDQGLRFLATVLVLNLAIFWVVFGLTRPIAGDQALLAGALMVLLTPFIDIVFSDVLFDYVPSVETRRTRKS